MILAILTLNLCLTLTLARRVTHLEGDLLTLTDEELDLLSEITGGLEDQNTTLPSAADLVKLYSSGSNPQGSLDSSHCLAVGKERMGCKASCKCGVLEQCYAKFVVIGSNRTLQSQSGSSHLGLDRVNIGVCGTAMPVLAILSLFLFFSVMISIIVVRMHFQAQEPKADVDPPLPKSSKAWSSKLKEDSPEDANYRRRSTECSDNVIAQARPAESKEALPDDSQAQVTEVPAS